MKTFTKVFIISCICFFIAMLLGSYSSMKMEEVKLDNNIGGSLLEDKPKEIKHYSNLEDAIRESERINILILGLENVRTDTIILASFCPDTKSMDLINIPRDTYIHRKGYSDPTQRKINSIYADHGVKGVQKAVSYILNDIPIDHHIILDYEGVEKIIDSLGGIEVEVPFEMKYEDPTSNPPVNININAGKQILNGKQSLDFLRYRQGNNNEGYVDGDLGRIRAQQSFMSAFLDKSLKNPINVITKGFKHLKTDISLMDSMSYGRKAIGMSKEDFKLQILPGEGEFKKVNKKVLSYYIYNKMKSEEMIKEIYKVEDPEF